VKSICFDEFVICLQKIKTKKNLLPKFEFLPKNNFLIPPVNRGALDITPKHPSVSDAIFASRRLRSALLLNKVVDMKLIKRLSSAGDVADDVEQKKPKLNLEDVAALSDVAPAGDVDMGKAGGLEVNGRHTARCPICLWPLGASQCYHSKTK
jgi:hypothetical protein